MRLVIRKPVAYPTEGLRMNIVFHVPGPMFKPDYEGVHATRFDKRSQHVLVVAAVPTHLVIDEVAGYVCSVLREARQSALEYLRERNVQVDSTQVSDLIDHLLVQLEAATAL